MNILSVKILGLSACLLALAVTACASQAAEAIPTPDIASSTPVPEQPTVVPTLEPSPSMEERLNQVEERLDKLAPPTKTRTPEEIERELTFNSRLECGWSFAGGMLRLLDKSDDGTQLQLHKMTPDYFSKILNGFFGLPIKPDLTDAVKHMQTPLNARDKDGFIDATGNLVNVCKKYDPQHFGANVVFNSNKPQYFGGYEGCSRFYSATSARTVAQAQEYFKLFPLEGLVIWAEPEIKEASANLVRDLMTGDLAAIKESSAEMRAACGKYHY